MRQGKVNIKNLSVKQKKKIHTYLRVVIQLVHGMYFP